MYLSIYLSLSIRLCASSLREGMIVLMSRGQNKRQQLACTGSQPAEPEDPGRIGPASGWIHSAAQRPREIRPDPMIPTCHHAWISIWTAPTGQQAHDQMSFGVVAEDGMTFQIPRLSHVAQDFLQLGSALPDSSRLKTKNMSRI